MQVNYGGKAIVGLCCLALLGACQATGDNGSAVSAGSVASASARIERVAELEAEFEFVDEAAGIEVEIEVEGAVQAREDADRIRIRGDFLGLEPDTDYDFMINGEVVASFTSDGNGSGGFDVRNEETELPNTTDGDVLTLVKPGTECTVDIPEEAGGGCVLLEGGWEVEEPEVVELPEEEPAPEEEEPEEEEPVDNGGPGGGN